MEQAAYELNKIGFLSDLNYSKVQSWSGDTLLFKQYVLEACYQTLLDKYGINSFGQMVFAIDDSIAGDDIIQLKANTIDRINELNTTGILTKKEYDHLIATANERLIHPDMVWEVLIGYYQISQRNSPDKLMHLSNQLQDLRLLDADGLQRVSQQIKDEIITNAFEVITSSPNALLIDTSLYNNETDEQFIKSYLYAINKHFLIGEIGNLDVSMTESTVFSDEEFKQLEATVSYSSFGTKYRYKNTYYKRIKNFEGFYKVFNAELADQLNHSRLYLLHQTPTSNTPRPPTALLMLTKAQGEALFTSLSSQYYLRLSYEEFAKVSNTEIKEQLTQLKEIGLFDGIDEATYKKTLEEVTELHLSLADALLQFPNLTYQFDVELGNIENPYEELLQEFARISKGKFNPTQIKDGFDIDKGGTFEVSFVWDGKTYKVNLTVNNDWVDESFESYVNDVVVGNVTGYKFFYTPYEFFIFANDEQYHLLNKMGIFDWENY